MKKFNELEESYDKEKVSNIGFDEIAENENVDFVICNGGSGYYMGFSWYTAYGLIDEQGHRDEFDFYMRGYSHMKGEFYVED